ncbi:predicted protein [Streptomyces pristinaespiralis ATCC 25486]|uniref:Predicted protein n=1 Tax=Streptomyces pristinaespiralis (strain ATCC 25486 / DSM 40338 / CBS 914.69 / JCM 4507 / KCC S-0507 / NBRC 13074 / NRRL 2958 / 5647) TaxID=457429 RepID=B5HDW1_STRE2|nr:predicted protein [Streptomyces pristinaespiralis ATCC 25486]
MAAVTRSAPRTRRGRGAARAAVTGCASPRAGPGRGPVRGSGGAGAEQSVSRSRALAP